MEQIALKNNQSVYTFHNNNKKPSRTPKKNNTRSLSRKASQNRPPIFTTTATSAYNYEGLFHNPHQRPSLSSFSYPPSLFSSQQKPPLLPLPIAPISRNPSLPCRARDLSCSPPTPRRNSLRNNGPRKQPRPPRTNKSEETCVAVVASTNRLGPEPGDLPQSCVGLGDGGAVFSLISPPPSSLPLPRFSLRPPKLSCNAEAAATDNLRRMLRLP